MQARSRRVLIEPAFGCMLDAVATLEESWVLVAALQFRRIAAPIMATSPKHYMSQLT